MKRQIISLAGALAVTFFVSVFPGEVMAQQPSGSRGRRFWRRLGATINGVTVVNNVSGLSNFSGWPHKRETLKNWL